MLVLPLLLSHEFVWWTMVRGSRCVHLYAYGDEPRVCAFNSARVRPKIAAKRELETLDVAARVLSSPPDSCVLVLDYMPS